SVAGHQSGIHLFHLLGHEAKLRDAAGVQLVLVAEGYRLKRENRFARLVHRFDRIFEARRGSHSTEVAARVYDDRYASSNGDSANPGDEGIGLCSHLADANCIGLGGYTFIAYVDIVTARGEADACVIA